MIAVSNLFGKIQSYGVGTFGCLACHYSLAERGGDSMQDVRNAVGKLVCRADGKSHRVEIVRKGQLTVVSFGRNGSVRVTNASKQ